MVVLVDPPLGREMQNVGKRSSELSTHRLKTTEGELYVNNVTGQKNQQRLH